MIVQGNAFHLPLPTGVVQTCVTSPPYWGLRDYGIDGQLGLERTPEEYVEHMVACFREVWRVLRDDGTLWLNLGDSYASGWACNRRNVVGAGAPPIDERVNKLSGALKEKDLVGIPWRVAFALQADGWYLRSDIIWSKPNPMPESVKDRPTKAHEYLFLLTKSQRYYYDHEAIKEDGVQYEIERRPREYQQGLNTKHVIASDGKTGQTPPSEHGAIKNLGRKQELAMSGKRNRRSVWAIPTQPTPVAHFATFPERLVEPCILAGTSERGACPRCGKPWVRVIEKGLTAHTGETETPYPVGSTANRLALLRQAARKNGGEYANENKTAGWRPGCACNAGDPIPCLVLDPFVGSGTTARVAARYNRRFVGVDLSLKYLVEIASKRQVTDVRML